MAAPLPAPSPFATHWDLDPGVVFLNHGSFGACPRVVLAEQQRLRREGIECDFVLTSFPWDVAVVLLGKIKKNPADLIVLTARRGLMNQRLLGQTLRDIISSARVPVLLVHA